MRGLLGGLLTGTAVSALGLGAVSLITELPPGTTPPAPPQVTAPQVDPVTDPETPSTDASGSSGPGLSTPVGSVSITEPQAPDLPEGEAPVEPGAPATVSPEAQAPRADTDPLDVPQVASVEGAMDAPDTPDGSVFAADPVDPVFPNPQSLAPQTPTSEADLTVSTAPAQPIVVIEPEIEPEADETPATDTPTAPPPLEDTFVVDLGADAAPQNADADAVVVGDDASAADTTPPVEDASADGAPESDAALVDAAPDLSSEDILAAAVPDTPRLQLQGSENTLLGDRDTGVTVRRPTGDADASEGTADAEDTDAPDTAVTDNALAQFAAPFDDPAGKPLMSIVLIDDGSMSAAAAALAGLPFPVTIALDPRTDGVSELMDRYRADGFEVAVLARLPEGAQPSDVEVTFESLFRSFPETIALLDVGNSGLQDDRAVTQQAMDILASQGRGFITVSQGLNMAGRAAEQAGVPASVVFRDLDADNQDARVVRRFVDQAAFRARQSSGVVLVGRVRPDTISALILWGSANQDDQVAVVPVSAVLTAPE